MSLSRVVRQLVVVAVGCLLLNVARADEISVAVAANFTAAMNDVARGFEQASGHKLKLSFGSSGKIFAQIQNGAPYQVFLSADQDKPQALEQAGQVVPGSRFTYAIGALVLWSGKPDFIDAEHTRLTHLEFNKLALANPRVAPYGAAAVEVLEALRLRQGSQAKWVQGENIAQTYQFVASGNADLGFVALSQVMVQGKISTGSSWIVPAELYSPIRQDAVLLRRAKDNTAAKALLAYLRSDAARTIIHSYGYQTE